MRKLTLLMVLLLTLGVASVALADRDDDHGSMRGMGERGEHMGAGRGGWGHGGMGHGMGHGGMGMMDPQNHPAFASLSKDKQEAMKKLYTDFAKSILADEAEMKTHMIDMRQVMRTFPLNRKEAEKHHDAMHKAGTAMHAKMLNYVEAAQKILGEADYTKLTAMPAGGDRDDCPKGDKKCKR